jgi:transposase
LCLPMSKHRFGNTDNDTLERKREVGAPEGLQRVEVITGVGRRRRWSQEAKARIVLESRQLGAVVSEVARQHGLKPQQLFGWRREARNGMAGGDAHDSPRPVSAAFAPVVVATAGDHSEKVAGIAAAGGGQIEIAIAGALVRLRGGFDARTLAAVLQAVRAIA